MTTVQGSDKLREHTPDKVLIRGLVGSLQVLDIFS